MLTANPQNTVIGEFVIPEFNTRFDFCKTSDEWAVSHDLQFEIHTTGGVRFARILKTVAYVAVDENTDGTPKLEKWNIRHQWQRNKFC